MFNPETHTEGGGGISDVDVEFTSVKCALTTFNGKEPDGVPQIEAEVTFLDNPERPPWHANWGIGGRLKGKAFPTEDGKAFVDEDGGDTIHLNKSCKASRFLRSLTDNGIDGGAIDKDITRLIGLKAHVVERPMDDLDFGTREGQEQQAVPRVLLVESVIEAPNMNGQAKAASGAKPKAKRKKKAAAEPDEAADDIVAEAEAAIMEILNDPEVGDEVPLSGLPKRLMVALKGSKSGPAIAELAMQPDFLSADERPFGYDEKAKEVYLPEGS